MKYTKENIKKYDFRYYEENGWKGWRKNKNGIVKYLLMNNCKNCGDMYLTPYTHPGKFCSFECSKKLKPSDYSYTKEDLKIVLSNDLTIKHKNKNNYSINKALYKTSYKKIGWCEDTQSDPANQKLLQVKCRYCGKWFNPTNGQVDHRYKAIKSGKGSGLLYCSDHCKQACPIFHRIKYPKGHKSDNHFGTSREVQPELRQLVLERDNYTCQKCNIVNTELHCHHVEGIRWEPLESADIDKCITYCKHCHKEAHEKEGCTFYDFRCEQSYDIVSLYMESKKIYKQKSYRKKKYSKQKGVVSKWFNLRIDKPKTKQRTQSIFLSKKFSKKFNAQ